MLVRSDVATNVHAQRIVPSDAVFHDGMFAQVNGYLSMIIHRGTVANNAPIVRPVAGKLLGFRARGHVAYPLQQLIQFSRRAPWRCRGGEVPLCVDVGERNEATAIVARARQQITVGSEARGRDEHSAQIVNAGHVALVLFLRVPQAAGEDLLETYLGAFLNSELERISDGKTVVAVHLTHHHVERARELGIVEVFRVVGPVLVVAAVVVDSAAGQKREVGDRGVPAVVLVIV